MAGTYRRSMRRAGTPPSSGRLRVVIAWQGGEPTMIGRLLRARRSTARGTGAEQRILNTMQPIGAFSTTPGHLLEGHGFLVGISINRPPAMHDAYRVDQAAAHVGPRCWRARRPRAARGQVDMLTTSMPSTATTPVARSTTTCATTSARHSSSSSRSSSGPRRTLQIADEGGAAGCAAGPCLARTAPSSPAARSLRGSPAAMIDVFEEWMRRDDVGEVYVQISTPPRRPGTAGALHGRGTCGSAAGPRARRRPLLLRPLRRGRYLLGDIGNRTMLELIDLPQPPTSGRPRPTPCPSSAATAT